MTAPPSSSALPPVIVGAGPAGVRAAEALVAHGLRPMVIDEASRAGGQIYRRPPESLAERSAQTLYGFEARRADSVHAAFDALQGRIDYRPDSLVWNAQGGRLDVLHGPTRSTASVAYGQLIIATGATDRVLPVRMYMYATESIDPLMAAVSALMVAVTAVAMVVLDRVYGLDRVLVGRR